MATREPAAEDPPLPPPPLHTPTSANDDTHADSANTANTRAPRGNVRDLGRYLRRRAIMGRAAPLARVGWLLYVAAAVWLALFPTDVHHKDMYVDENALLTGQANKYFDFNSLQAHLRPRMLEYDALPTERRAEMLRNELAEFGLDAGTQRVTLSTLGTAGLGSVQHNAYGAVRVPRGDGTEVLLVSAPWRCTNGRLNADGVTYLLTLAYFLRKHSFWAKDFVLVIPESTHSMQAFTLAYHQSRHDHVEKGNASAWSPMQFSPLTVHAGAIQQALNLEFCGNEDYTGLGITYEGVNGQLPNMDLIVVLMRLCRSEGVPAVLHRSKPQSHFSRNDMYEYYANNLLEGLQIQALGMPPGAHGVLPKFGVDAITILGKSKSEEAEVRYHEYTFGTYQIIWIIEQALRSYNNLLEHFHHSMFFYILPSTNQYIPISVYAPLTVLLCLPLIIEALMLWFPMGSKEGVPEFIKASTSGMLLLTRNGQPSYDSNVRPVLLPLLVFATVLLAGGAVLVAAFLLQQAGVQDTTFVLAFLGLLVAVQIVLPFVLSRVVNVVAALESSCSAQNILRKRVFDRATGAVVEQDAACASTTTASEQVMPTWRVLKCLLCLWTSAVILGLSVLNLALALTMSLILVPVVWASRAHPHPLRRALTLALITAANPALLVALWYRESTVPFITNLWTGFTVFGNWIFPLASVFYVPCLTAAMLVTILPPTHGDSATVREQTESKKDK